MSLNVGHVDRVGFTINTVGGMGSFQFSPYLYAQVWNRQITPLGGAAGASYNYNVVDDVGDVVDAGSGAGAQNWNGLTIYVGYLVFTISGATIDGAYRCKIWLIS